ncbi:Branched-chain-amino-acid aminotransferase [Falsiruegeria litorea R37]|uniref:Probable branched-chain-amino-acid aminotransferase n=1 Tax=Falsiruegeria litorea R37 TaxID=1200284 RepID=A0A1Y5TEM5_9RHOB|nr:aminotransferase class IV [Falsiruegeria litorea]SLN60206.1 Branched-chain-amino-acid aminotransferase [Falsiruegeria litorea R37]
MSTLPKLSDRHVDARNYPPGVSFMDGQYLPIHEAKLSVLDYGFLHSDATYDVVHVWKGAFFRLDDHLDRFFRGMGELHMSIPYDRAQVAEILHNCVALSGLENAYVEFICTRGTSPDFSRDPRDAENRFIAFAIPFGSVANKQQLEKGLHLAVTDILRIPALSVDPTVKNYHWLDMIKALYVAYDLGADTAILVDGSGDISEGPGFNVFVIKDGAVSTPGASVLLGVTRQTVFEICKEMRLECQVRAISRSDLLNADEVFITSTAGGVMPVSKVDGRSIGSGAIGTQSKRIMDRYWQLHDAPRHRTPVSYA